MKFITTFHHSKNFGMHFATKERFEEVGLDYSAVDLSDPEYARIYGTLPKAEFMELWKAKLKEVIYDTRPWIVASDNDNVHFTASKDGSTMYVFAFESPGEELVIKSLAEGSELCPWEISEVQQLGNGNELEFRQDTSGLVISAPDIDWNPYATGLKISFSDFDPDTYTVLKEEKMKEYEQYATYGKRRKR